MTDHTNFSAEYPLGPTLEFLQKLWKLNHALESVSSHMASQIGITAQQRLVIRCLGRYPGLTAGGLASVLHLDPGTISATLRRLVAKGLVQRRQDPRDKRRAELGLTAKGRTFDQATSGTVENAVERLLKATKARDLEITVTTIEELTKRLRNEMSS